MSGKTSIEWTGTYHSDGSVTPGKVWNPLSGCTRATEGCRFCYAFELHDRRHEAYKKFNGVYPNGTKIPEQYSKPFSEVQLLPQRLEDPLKIKTPTKFFTNSMSDLFHSDVPEEYIRQVFDTMRRAHWHIFQILTKRAGRLRRLGPQLEWPPNIWMGVSIESDELTPRANALREVPAAVRFLSCEPLLGPLPSLDLEGLHWIIVGGESGPSARLMNPDWARDIRDKCIASEVPFFFKQYGGRTPNAGGRMLDGRTYDEMPSELPTSQATLF
jgi:Bacteriophage protein gp37